MMYAKVMLRNKRFRAQENSCFIYASAKGILQFMEQVLLSAHTNEFAKTIFATLVLCWFEYMLSLNIVF